MGMNRMGKRKMISYKRLDGRYCSQIIEKMLIGKSGREANLGMVG